MHPSTNPRSACYRIVTRRHRHRNVAARLPAPKRALARRGRVCNTPGVQRGSMIFVERCAGCGTRGPVLCRPCRFALVGRASSSPPGVLAAVAFTGRPRDVLLGLKYGNCRPVARHLGGLLVNRLVAAGVRAGVDVDIVTWAPTSRRRRHHRGFDQAELIARAVARQLGLPCRRLLEREGNDPQTGRSRADRLSNPAFRAAPSVTGRRVLVIDDVATTGATLRQASSVLDDMGASSVICAAVAATPGRQRTCQVIQGPWAATPAAVVGEPQQARSPADRSRHPSVPRPAPARTA